MHVQVILISSFEFLFGLFDIHWLHVQAFCISLHSFVYYQLVCHCGLVDNTLAKEHRTHRLEPSYMQIYIGMDDHLKWHSSAAFQLQSVSCPPFKLYVFHDFTLSFYYPHSIISVSFFVKPWQLSAILIHFQSKTVHSSLFSLHL